MKILMLTPWLPHPPNWGFAKRVFHTIEVLARRHEVTLLSYSEGHDAASIKVLQGLCHAVHTVVPTPPPFGKRVAQLASLASRTSFQRRMTVSAPMQQALDRLLKETAYDVVHLQSSQMAGFRFAPGSVVVLDEHNIEYELYYRMYQGEGSLFRRYFSWLEYHRFKREEIASWQSVAGCATTSEREARIINGIAPDLPTVVVPNAVDTEYFSPSSAPVDPHAIVFTGLMKYRPNVDGAAFFVKDILPRIVAVEPRATFYIVGADPPPQVLQLASPNVIVTGSVPDVRPFVERAAVFVVPLRMGSGTRLKVLEGLAMGKPMVSTALGCEGIELTHGEHLLIADDAQPFADAVLEVMQSPARAQHLSKEGRALVLRQYRWDTAVEALETLYARVTASRRADGDLAHMAPAPTV